MSQTVHEFDFNNLLTALAGAVLGLVAPFGFLSLHPLVSQSMVSVGCGIFLFIVNKFVGRLADRVLDRFLPDRKGEAPK